jgi:hypothetical protein
VNALVARIPAVRRRMLAAWAVGLVLGAAAFRLAAWSATTLPRPNPLEELAYYPSGRSLAPATLGHAETAADLAWLRAIQYYGEHRRSDNRFEHLYHVFDVLTTLAPRFESAYVFGAFALAQEGRDFARADQLLAKGLEANPTSARLAFETGFLHYVKPGGRDLTRAAEYFELAARLPHAPPMAAQFAAFARQNSGGLPMAYALWARVRETSANGYLREIAEREMARIREAMVRNREDLARSRISTPVVLIGGRP